MPLPKADVQYHGVKCGRDKAITPHSINPFLKSVSRDWSPRFLACLLKTVTMWTHTNPFHDNNPNFSGKRSFLVSDLLHLQSCGASFLPQEFYSARQLLENDNHFARVRMRSFLDHECVMEKYLSTLADSRRHSSSLISSSSSSSALGPLKAFCATKQVERLVSADLCPKTASVDREQTNILNNNNSSTHAQPKNLKFGVNRILSDDFGKSDENSIEKRRKQKRRSPSPKERFSAQEPCGCGICKYSLQSRLNFPSPSLSAVHALQPPSYPLAQSIDSLPGPYAVLNDDGTCNGQSKRKRSWSRAVFSNLQRKGLEKRFEVQKYVTKPDRRQLAAMLGLTDAQVKVWFQNRRMKWRHAQQQLQAEGGDSSDHLDGKSVVESSSPMDSKDSLAENEDCCVELQETKDDEINSTCSGSNESENCHFTLGSNSPFQETTIHA